MYQKVLQILYAEDKAIIDRLAISIEDSISSHFSINDADFIKTFEIGDGIYVLSNTDTQSKLSVLSRLFKMYEVEPSDLVFYLRGETDDDSRLSLELRKKYWAYFLDYIRESCPDCNNLFRNRNPLMHNSISAYSDSIENGFSIYCIANLDSIRVDLVFDHFNKEKNKSSFDFLSSHKVQIETSLGVKLVWNRGDNIKSSKISYMLRSLNVVKKEDWNQMARFHAEWSKKFYDVFIPYLKSIL